MAFRFERLDVWPLALDYTDACLTIAQELPRELQFSFGDQLRRAAISILANIAEGAGKGTSRSEGNYYDIAHGSVAETVALLILLRRRNLVSGEAFDTLYQRANRISAMLWGLRQSTFAESGPIYELSESIDSI